MWWIETHGTSGWECANEFFEKVYEPMQVEWNSRHEFKIYGLCE